MAYKSMVAECYTDEKGNVWSIAPDGGKSLIKSVLTPDESKSIADMINV